MTDHQGDGSTHFLLAGVVGRNVALTGMVVKQEYLQALFMLQFI